MPGKCVCVLQSEISYKYESRLGQTIGSFHFCWIQNGCVTYHLVIVYASMFLASAYEILASKVQIAIHKSSRICSLSRSILAACDYCWNTEKHSRPFTRVRPLNNSGVRSDREASPKFSRELAVWRAGLIQKAEADVEGRLDPTEALASRIPLVIPAIVAGRSVAGDDEPSSPINASPFLPFCDFSSLQGIANSYQLDHVQPSMNRSSIVRTRLKISPIPALSCISLRKVYH